jgi:hypothetical protein
MLIDLKKLVGKWKEVRYDLKNLVREYEKVRYDLKNMVRIRKMQVKNLKIENRK